MFKEGGGTSCGPKGPKGKRSFWTTEMMCLWRGPPMATEAFSKGTQPAHGDQVWGGQKNENTKLTFLPPSRLLPVPQRRNSTDARGEGGRWGRPHGQLLAPGWTDQDYLRNKRTEQGPWLCRDRLSLVLRRKHAVRSTRMNG